MTDTLEEVGNVVTDGCVLCGTSGDLGPGVSKSSVDVGSLGDVRDVLDIGLNGGTSGVAVVTVGLEGEVDFELPCVLRAIGVEEAEVREGGVINVASVSSLNSDTTVGDGALRILVPEVTFEGGAVPVVPLPIDEELLDELLLHEPVEISLTNAGRIHTSLLGNLADEAVTSTVDNVVDTANTEEGLGPFGFDTSGVGIADFVLSGGRGELGGEELGTGESGATNGAATIVDGRAGESGSGKPTGVNIGGVRRRPGHEPGIVGRLNEGAVLGTDDELLGASSASIGKRGRGLLIGTQGMTNMIGDVLGTGLQLTQKTITKGTGSLLRMGQGIHTKVVLSVTGISTQKGVKKTRHCFEKFDHFLLGRNGGDSTCTFCFGFHTGGNENTDGRGGRGSRWLLLFKLFVKVNAFLLGLGGLGFFNKKEGVKVIHDGGEHSEAVLDTRKKINVLLDLNDDVHGSWDPKGGTVKKILINLNVLRHGV